MTASADPGSPRSVICARKSPAPWSDCNKPPRLCRHSSVIRTSITRSPDGDQTFKLLSFGLVTQRSRSAGSVVTVAEAAQGDPRSGREPSQPNCLSGGSPKPLGRRLGVFVTAAGEADEQHG